MKTKIVPDEAKIIGLNLRQMRELHGLTQINVAEYLNISSQQVQKYEAGANRLPIEHLYKIRAFLDVPFEYFFIGLDDDAHDVDRPFYQRCFDYCSVKLMQNEHSHDDAFCRKLVMVL